VKKIGVFLLKNNVLIQFLLNLAVFCVKNALFRNFFSEIILKIITPDTEAGSLKFLGQSSSLEL
jgi:hypothetical protein